MHIKHMHEMIEKLAEYGKNIVDAGTGCGNVNIEATKWIIEMIEKLAEAEYHARIAKAMEEADEEEKEDIKYIIKKMKEEGEDWDEDEARRFYRGQPRSRTSGRFMSRGDGRRSNRGGKRGYEDAMIPMDYLVNMEDYSTYPPEYWRDIDRKVAGRMYYASGAQPSGGNSGNQGGQSNGGSSSGGMSGNMGGSSSNNTRGYSDGYSDGYREGERNNKQSENRYDKAKRGYEEAKAAHSSNSAEDKQARMKEAEKTANVFLDALVEMVEDESPEVKSMIKTKGMSKLQKLQ